MVENRSRSLIGLVAPAHRVSLLLLGLSADLSSTAPGPTVLSLLQRGSALTALDLSNSMTDLVP